MAQQTISKTETVKTMVQQIKITQTSNADMNIGVPKTQTALDFFLMKLVDLEIGKTFYANQHQDLQDAFKQAKQMEKEQIINAMLEEHMFDDSEYANRRYKYWQEVKQKL